MRPTGVRVLAGTALVAMVVLGGLFGLALAHAQWSSSRTSSGSINAGPAAVLTDTRDTNDIKFDNPTPTPTLTPMPTPTPVALPAVQLPIVGGQPPSASEGGSSPTALLYILMVGAAAMAATMAAGRWRLSATSTRVIGTRDGRDGGWTWGWMGEEARPHRRR